mmetsp:Transcript_29739/g.69905  ORF Transcript_29739/g.69905 Transcript_29739/m.69905 type:complete len:275 (+) Transcript_29739:190-1014(+)
MPPSGSPFVSASRPRLPATRCMTSVKARSFPLSASMEATSAATLFLNTRAVLARRRNISTVSSSLACSILCLNDSGQLHSLVAQMRVPRLTPSAPSASAAASCLPSLTPPLQTKGVESTLAPLAWSTKLPTSPSPGWPAHSKPSREMMWTPSRSAESACRMVTHLWMVMSPAFLKVGTQTLGFEPAVSTILTPSSMMTLAYSSYGGGGPIVGRMVRLTPKGRFVSLAVRRIHERQPSGLPALWAAKIPRPPAFETAAASSGVPTPVMPPIMMGC